MDYKRIIIKPVGISLASIALFTLVIFIVQADINRRSAEYIDKQSQITNNSESIKSFVSLQADSEKSKQYGPIVDNYFISRDQLINFPKDINAMAHQSSLDFTVNFGAETTLTKTDPRKTAIYLTSQVPANFTNFIGFLKYLENSYYIVNLNNLDASQEGNQFKVNLTGQVFSF